MKGWRGTFCWLHPRESGPEVTCLVSSWCGASWTI